jgi:glutathione S-transferase
MASAAEFPLPVLWSFCRCPYAIRARLALAAAALEPGLHLEVREINLAAKAPEFLALGPPATVPVLVPPDGPPLRESLEIMVWALEQHDPEDWLWRRQGSAADGDIGKDLLALVAQNDGLFKHHLDRFKYASRYPASDPIAHREAGLAILRTWNGRLERSGGGGAPGWLLGERSSLADWALLPFVRQFRLADPGGFEAAEGLGALRGWLNRFEESPQWTRVMAPPLAPAHPWRSPSWIYHLALADEWRQARAEGVYRRSTRGLALEQVGFLHASHGHQIGATYERFYADAGPVRLLSIDPARLASAGLMVAEEPAPESGELFPHIYGGPLPCTAVVAAEAYTP